MYVWHSRYLTEYVSEVYGGKLFISFTQHTFYSESGLVEL